MTAYESVWTTMSCKLAVLHRIGSSYYTRSRAHIYTSCIKPHLEYCLPVWACCGGEQARLDKLLERAKRIITKSKTVLLTNDDFTAFGLDTFSNIKFLSVYKSLF